MRSNDFMHRYIPWRLKSISQNYSDLKKKKIDWNFFCVF